MKIRGNIDTAKDNYILKQGSKQFFVFNHFKTTSSHGHEQIGIPTTVNTILKKWFSICNNDYLLFDTNNNKLTSVKVTQRLNGIFQKNVSTSMLRHTYLSGKYGGSIEMHKNLEKI
jgi:hypothetical protein